MIQKRRKDETGATEKAQVGAKTRALYEQCNRYHKKGLGRQCSDGSRTGSEESSTSLSN